MIVYHGTSAHFMSSIEDNGLIPKNHRKHVYVTTDYNRAREYSLIWTGGLIYEEQQAVRFGEKEFYSIDTNGIIVCLDIPTEMLMIDDYNLETEPDQYKILGEIDPSLIKNIEYIYFDEYSDYIDEESYQENLLYARAKLVGVSQWGKD